MNQLLRLPLLNYTHTEKKFTYVKGRKTRKIIMIKEKQYHPPSPRKTDSYNTQNGGPHGNSQGKGAVTITAKTSTPEVGAFLDFLILM